MNAPTYVFDSPARRIVEYKWENAQFYVILEALLYLVLAFLVTIDVWYLTAFIRIKLIIMIFTICLLLKLLIRMYLFATFKFRRECSYHIEYENNNQLKHNLSIFLSNPFNFFDISGHVLIIAYCLIFIIQEKNAINSTAILERERSVENYGINLIHLLAIFFILTRGCLSTFRLLRKTRYLVGMVLEVFNDISGFLFILFSSSLVFSVIFMFLERNMQED